MLAALTGLVLAALLFAGPALAALMLLAGLILVLLLLVALRVVLLLLVSLRVLFIRHLEVLQSYEGGFGLRMTLVHQDNHKRRMRFRFRRANFTQRIGMTGKNAA
ncbi:MAG: hypothetical protein ABSB37_10975 [Xanthobacteraceae bacterium]